MTHYFKLSSFIFLVFLLNLLISISQSYFIGPKPWSSYHNIQLAENENYIPDLVEVDQKDLQIPEEPVLSAGVICYNRCRNWIHRGLKAYRTCVDECLKVRGKVKTDYPWNHILDN